MTNLYLNALTRFPSKSYYDINKGLEGIATFDSLQKDKDEYTAFINFEVEATAHVILTMTKFEGTIVEISPSTETATTTPAVIQNFTKKRKYTRRAAAAIATSPTKVSTKRGAQIAKMRSLLKTWQSSDELATGTGWPRTTVHSRLTGLRKLKILQRKKSPKGHLIYRIAV